MALPVIFDTDTDIGSDIDDTWALAFLLRCPSRLARRAGCVPLPRQAKERGSGMISIQSVSFFCAGEKRSRTAGGIQK